MKQIGSFHSKEWGAVFVLRSTYGNDDTGPLAIVLELANHEPLATLSVNIYSPGLSQDSRNLPANCFYAKTWSENAELAREALASGLFKVRRDIPLAMSGFVTAPAWEVLS